MTSNFTPLTAAAFCFGGVLILYQLVQYVAVYLRRRAFKRSRGCQPPKYYPHKDPILGLDLFFTNIKLVKSGDFLTSVRQRFARMEAWTYTQLLVGNTIINTTEPENIKAILATQFKEFTLPKIRLDALVPVFGHGIFTTDGKQWVRILHFQIVTVCRQDRCPEERFVLSGSISRVRRCSRASV